VPVTTEDGSRPGSRWLAWLSAACIAGWAIPALMMLGKGFAVQDEGS
jgi:hypothetical protein